MSSSQHRDVGRNYHALAMRLISEGHPEAAGELLWGAMDRITKAVAEHHGLTRQGTGQPLRRKLDFAQNLEKGEEQGKLA